MRHLARQRLPALESRDVNQTLLRLLQLLGHVVERAHGRADFVFAQSVSALWNTIVHVPGRDFRQALRQLLDRMADALRKVQQREKGQQPDAGRQQQIGVGKTAPPIVCARRRDQSASGGVLIGKLLHRDAIQRCRIHVDAIPAPNQVLDAVTLQPGQNKVLRFLARKELLHRGRPTVASGRREFLRTNAPGRCICLQRFRSPAIQLMPGLLERARYLIQVLGRRERETILQQSHREPSDQAQWRERGGHKHQDQPAA